MEEEAPMQHCSIVGARGRVSIFFEGLGPWMHGRIPARWHLPRWEIQCRYSAPMYSRFPGRCLLRRVLAPLEPCATGAVVSELWHRGDERHNGTGRGPVTTAAYLSCLRALLLSARMKNGSHAILCFVSVLLDPPRLPAVCASLE